MSKTIMKTFTIQTLGCKVNQYESRQIEQFLQQRSMTPANGGGADLVVINTCCVTHAASSKSRQYIRKAGKCNPNARIVVAGCLPVGQADELSRLDALGDRLVVVEDKDRLAEVLADLTAGADESQGSDIKELSGPDFDILHTYSGQNRAFLKVQDGCDGFCTYCIIPRIRTRVCNKRVNSVLEEAQALVGAGHKEIVLTGIFLGAYGQDTVRRQHWDPARLDCLADLVEELAQVEGLQRLRLSSLEPGDVTDRLVEVMAKYDNIMPHLHLPLQSGSARILKRMARQYGLEDFYKSISKLRLALDRPAVTTDIIVGFPGETDADFESTMRVAEEVGFSKVHVFSYSDRAGTPAEKLQAKVRPEVIKERSRRLQELDRGLQRRFREQFKGERVGVIVEAEDPPRGRCERYFMVRVHENRNAPTGHLVYETVR